MGCSILTWLSFYTFLLSPIPWTACLPPWKSTILVGTQTSWWITLVINCTCASFFRLSFSHGIWKSRANTIWSNDDDDVWWNTVVNFWLHKTRPSQDMEGAFYTDFSTFQTIWGIVTKILAFLQLSNKWILPKFERFSLKNRPAMPNWSCRHFLVGNPNRMHLKPSFLVQSGFFLRLTTSENLVLIYQSTFEKFKIEHFSLWIPSLVGQKIVFEKYFKNLILQTFQKWFRYYWPLPNCPS